MCEPSLKLPLESYSTRENADGGAWVLLEVEQEDARVRRSRRATTPNVRHTRDFGVMSVWLLMR